MFPSKRSAISFTVAIYLALALASAGLVEASGHEQVQDLHRRIGQNRMIKKRAVDTPTGTTTSAASATSDVVVSDTTTSTKVSSASVTTTSNTVTTTSLLPISISSTLDITTSLDVSITSKASSASSTAVSSSSSSVSSSASLSSSSSITTTSSATTQTTATTPPPVNTSEDINVTSPPETSPTNTAKSTVRTAVTRTVTSAEESATSTASASTGAVSKTTKTTLTVIAAIAGSVGGAFLLWTIIRKWKFRPSAEFEDRMQPIDWQPTDPNDSGLPAHRRANSAASSFHSGAGHTADDNLAGRGMASYGATSDHGHAAQQAGIMPIPDHDFTAPAGAPGLAPVGGYADLARGPSPQPQMQEMGRGPAAGAAAYDYGVPLHHQAGYGQQEAYYNNGARY